MLSNNLILEVKMNHDALFSSSRSRPYSIAYDVPFLLRWELTQHFHLVRWKIHRCLRTRTFTDSRASVRCTYHRLLKQLLERAIIGPDLVHLIETSHALQEQ